MYHDKDLIKTSGFSGNPGVWYEAKTVQFSIAPGASLKIEGNDQEDGGNSNSGHCNTAGLSIECSAGITEADGSDVIKGPMREEAVWWNRFSSGSGSGANNFGSIAARGG